MPPPLMGPTGSPGRRPFAPPLPHHPMPGTYPVYVSRLQFAAYLRAYQRLMGLDVRLNASVVAARPLPGGGGWARAAAQLGRPTSALSHRQPPTVAAAVCHGGDPTFRVYAYLSSGIINTATPPQDRFPIGMILFRW